MSMQFVQRTSSITSSGKKITRIDTISLELKRVAIYCRVSTEHEDQMHSLEAQVDYFRQYVRRPGWILAGEYIEHASAKNAKGRRQFSRLLEDCRAGKIDLIITKSISRFGRNTVETIEILRELKILGIDVYFENEELHSLSPDSELYISILAAYAEADNVSRSDNIKWGIEHQAQSNPDAAIYARPCFGYRRSEKAKLKIYPPEAKIVRLIYDLYLAGKSIYGIRQELAKRGIKTPTGNALWSNRTVDTILSNEKYMGDTIVYKTYCGEYPSNKRIANKGERAMYHVPDHHPTIISKEVFVKVQAEKKRRTNRELDERGNLKRKATRYSSKQRKAIQRR